MGRRMLAVAVLDATSVIVAVIMHIINMMTNGGRTDKPVNCCPIQSDNPDSCVASDNANPPPIKNIYQINRTLSLKLRLKWLPIHCSTTTTTKI